MGWSVNKIIILSFRVGTSENKHIDHGVKETCAIMSAQVTYEVDYISLLWDSAISSALNFCFYVLYRDLKENDHIKRNENSEKRNIYVRNQYYYFGLPKIRVGWPIKQKIELSSS